VSVDDKLLDAKAEPEYVSNRIRIFIDFICESLKNCSQRSRIAEVPELEFLSLGRSDKVK